MKRTKRIIGTFVAVMLVAFVPAAAAQADPFGVDITDAVLDLGGLTGVRAIDSTLEPPDTPATLDGEITGNDVTVPKAGFVFPTKNAVINETIPAQIDMEANQDITGTFDSGTGELSLDVDLKATVSVLGSTCVISPIEMKLTSENASPYLGVEFGSGLAGPGAVGGAWQNLPPATGGAFCGTVASLTQGAGGIWMSQDITNPMTCITDPENRRCEIEPVVVPPTEAPRIVSGPDSVTESKSATLTFAKGTGETQPVAGFRCSIDGGAFEACDSGSKTYDNLGVGSHTFKVIAYNSAGDGTKEGTRSWSVTEPPVKKAEFGPLTVKPKNKAVKRGKKVTLTAKISNIGDAAASGVKICVKAPAKLVKVKKCAKVGSIGAGASKTAKFKVTVKKKAKKGKKATLKFTATGTDLAKKTATAKVKVK